MDDYKSVEALEQLGQTVGIPHVLEEIWAKRNDGHYPLQDAALSRPTTKDNLSLIASAGLVAFAVFSFFSNLTVTANTDREDLFRLIIMPAVLVFGAFIWLKWQERRVDLRGQHLVRAAAFYREMTAVRDGLMLPGKLFGLASQNGLRGYAAQALVAQAHSVLSANDALRKNPKDSLTVQYASEADQRLKDMHRDFFMFGLVAETYDRYYQQAEKENGVKAA